MNARRLFVPLSIRGVEVWFADLWVCVLDGTGTLIQSFVVSTLTRIAVRFMDHRLATWTQLVAVFISRLT